MFRVYPFKVVNITFRDSTSILSSSEIGFTLYFFFSAEMEVTPWLYVVRNSPVPAGTPVTEGELSARLMPGDSLTGLLEHGVDAFLESHSVRIELPEGVTASSPRSGDPPQRSLSVNIGRTIDAGKSRTQANWKLPQEIYVRQLVKYYDKITVETQPKW